jgi:hypothetical protein
VARTVPACAAGIPESLAPPGRRPALVRGLLAGLLALIVSPRSGSQWGKGDHLRRTRGSKVSVPSTDSRSKDDTLAPGSGSAQDERPNSCRKNGKMLRTSRTIPAASGIASSVPARRSR